MSDTHIKCNQHWQFTYHRSNLFYCIRINRPHECSHRLSKFSKFLVKLNEMEEARDWLWNWILNAVKLYSLLLYKGQLASKVHQWQEQSKLFHLQSCHLEQLTHVQLVKRWDAGFAVGKQLKAKRELGFSHWWPWRCNIIQSVPTIWSNLLLSFSGQKQ